MGVLVPWTSDPTTRRLPLPNGKDVLVTDTVGFIQRLPTNLVVWGGASDRPLHSTLFRSTLFRSTPFHSIRVSFTRLLSSEGGRVLEF